MRFLAGLPIRVRLTVAFAAAMALVLAASGLFLYLRVNAALDRTIDQGLAGRADDVAALVRATDPGLGQAQGRRLLERDESFAQVLAPNGAVLDSTPGLHERQLLTGQELARATRATVIVDRPPFPDADDPLRLLATPVEAPGGRTVVVVVGASTEERAETLESLLGQLLLGGPLTLLAISLLGYLLAAAALRPVESMRREAEAVSASEPGRRLPLPPGDDEISRLGTTLNTMLDRLETALAQERRFVSDASHELRTPLASLRTELELALRRPRPAGELRSALASAAEETERLSRVADDLLVLARSDGGRLPVNPEPIPAAQLLAEVTERFGAEAAQAGRAIDLQAEDRLAVVVDRLRASQALGNLVDNALRHGRGRIRLVARRADGQAELHVQDEGPGFPEGFVDRAFDRFSRADPARQGPGAGLGLAIVGVIANAHGGSAHAANRDGGADVWLELPADTAT
ncbi:MAG TPA: ATP-binding protein [Actinomycetota bacterium]|nr:ATP-binding protein [Actinomycetota bacterium]